MIELTEILETDSVYQFGIKSNDNFEIIEDNINNIYNYLDVDASTITDLSNIVSTGIQIGNAGSYVFQADPTNGIQIDADVSLENGVITINTRKVETSYSTLDDTISNNRVYPNDSNNGADTIILENTTGSDVEFELAPTDNGQVIYFVYGSQNTADTKITLRPSTEVGNTSTFNFGLDDTSASNPFNALDLNQPGSTCVLKYIDEGSYTGYYIVSIYDGAVKVV